MKLNPECHKPEHIFFVKADGTFLPCCYLSANPVLQEYLGQELYSQLNLNDYSYQQIVNSTAWQKILASIESDDPIKACVWTCAKKRSSEEDLVGNVKKLL